MAENGKRQRAENRERRRSQTDAPASEHEESNGDAPDALHQAARAAAAAAAVGAAVGAVRAIASRVDEPEQEEPEEDEPKEDAPERDEPEPAAAQPDEPKQDDPEQDDPEQDERAPTAAEPTPSRRQDRDRDRGDGRAASASDAAAVVRRAREQLEALQGTAPESVSSLERIRNGWRVRLEVVEVHRVPDSTDVLAGYEVELDDDGGLLGYRRVQRYYRSQADGGGNA